MLSTTPTPVPWLRESLVGEVKSSLHSPVADRRMLRDGGRIERCPVRWRDPHGRRERAPRVGRRRLLRGLHGALESPVGAGVRRLVRGPHGGRWLDVGCGTGALTEAVL